MKKFFAVMLSALMLFQVSCVSVFAEEEIAVMVDGVKVVFDVNPVIENGRTLVPVRAVFEALGAQVDWKDGKVFSKKGDTEIILPVNENVLIKNGEEIALDVPATITDGRTLVPVRAISEAYGCNVAWNAAKKTVVVVSDASTVELANVEGISVPVGYYQMWLDQAAQTMASNLGAKVEDIISLWDTDVGGVTLGNQITELALAEVKVRKIMQSEAKKLGISLSDEQLAEIDANIEQMFSEGSEVPAGWTKELMKMQLVDLEYVTAYSDLVVKNSEKTTKEVREYLDKNYVRAKHILIMPEANENGEITQEAKDEAKKLADEVLLKAKRNKDFDMLVREYGEDPGVESNPEGYLFTKGEMVEPFEKAAFELGINEISGVVETEYGYHIIKRIKSDYTDEEIESCKTKIAQEEASNVFEQLYSKAQITVNEVLTDVLLPAV